MKLGIYRKLSLLAIISILLLTAGCQKMEDWFKSSDGQETLRALGWIGDKENTAAIENDIHLSKNTNIPQSVDLSNKFPPIGNQGQYGTCVAWATGYNLRSFLQATLKGYTKSQMASDNSKMFSAKDLFWSIPASQKGSSCDGTGFESALDMMVSRGVATMATVPYVDMGNCLSSPQSSWTSDAAKYKIDNYREIKKSDKSEIKKYLAEGRAVVFGAKLGENFMSWNSSTVLTTDGDTYKGQHAYHAMILCGYDDSKGANGAFRVVNSWGTEWGDGGYIWIDQNFFVSDGFCFCAFVGNPDVSNPDTNNDNTVDNTTTGTDLMAWELSDSDDPEYTDPLARVARYNVFNSGSTKITASLDWNILYVYYNAFDANDYGILLYDYYSNDYGTYGTDDKIPNNGGDGIVTSWYNYFDVDAGKSVAETMYGVGYRFKFPYDMPTNITGSYYLVLIADGYDKIKEVDESNNYFFYAQADGTPIHITKGVIDASNKLPAKKKSLVRPGLFEKSVSSTLKSQSNVNAYSPKEIMTMLQDRKQSGDIAQKAKAFLSNQKSLKNIKMKDTQ